MSTWKSKISKLTDQEQKRLSELVRSTAGQVVIYAKPAAPIDTGFLRNSIEIEIVDPFTAIVFVGAEYGIYVEMGTTRMRPRPFLTPAVDRAMADLRQQLKSIIK